MKRFLLVLAAILLGLVAGGAAFLWLKKPAQRAPSAERIELTPELLARGRYLYERALDCGGCHTERDWTRWGGPHRPGVEGAGGLCLGREEKFPGRICAPNITSDLETGIGGWSDGEILRAIREGVRRDGSALFPLMPWNEYAHLSDDDGRALVAHLRTLAPVRRATPRRELDFPLGLVVKFMPRPLAGPVPSPPPEGRGRYLAEVGGCRACHTPVDGKGVPLPGRDFAGGREFAGPWGSVRSSNLTRHDNGIGSWTRDAYLGVFQSLRAPEAAAVPIEPGRNTPMPWLAAAAMTDEDLGAIYDHLRTVAPQHDRSERRPRPEPAAAAETAP